MLERSCPNGLVRTALSEWSESAVAAPRMSVGQLGLEREPMKVESMPEAHRQESGQLKRWLAMRNLIITASLGMGIIGLSCAFGLARARADATVVQADRREIALLRTDEKSRWATRVDIDHVQRCVTLSRDIVYGHEPALVDEGDALLIPDEAGVQQISVHDRTIEVGDMEVRISLHRYGPVEAYRDRPNSSTELTLWVNGQARVVGFMEGSMYGDDGAPVWERISISRRGGVLVATASTGSYPIVRRGVVNGDLGTDNPWILEPSEAFPSSEDIDRFLQQDDDQATPTSLPATSTVARRNPLPS